MNTTLRGPVAAVSVALGVLMSALVLDQGSPQARDAALVLGSLALYALLPAAAIWLVVALVRRRRHAAPEHRWVPPHRAAIAVVALTGAFIVAMDWLPTPLNRNIAHVDAAQRLPGTLIHGLACAAVCLVLARGPRWAQRMAPVWFAAVLASAVLNWWVPYVAGSYPGEIDPRTFTDEYAANLSLLPMWAGHPVVPDVQHTLIHALLLASLVATAWVAVSRADLTRTGITVRPNG
jgi:hypothetical protein